MIVWNTNIFYPANFELKRIKAAKAASRRVFQASFVSPCMEQATDPQQTIFSVFRL